MVVQKVFSNSRLVLVMVERAFQVLEEHHLKVVKVLVVLLMVLRHLHGMVNRLMLLYLFLLLTS